MSSEESDSREAEWEARRKAELEAVLSSPMCPVKFIEAFDPEAFAKARPLYTPREPPTGAEKDELLNHLAQCLGYKPAQPKKYKPLKKLVSAEAVGQKEDDGRK